MVRCKYSCHEITKTKNWDSKSPNKWLYRARFGVVSATSEENKKFFEATPSGTIEVGTYKEDHFEPGKEYFVDFTEAPDIRKDT